MIQTAQPFALVIPADPTVQAYTLDTRADLAQLQSLVGGWIEIVRGGALPGVEGDWFMIINEEGKTLQLPMNLRATNLMATAGLHLSDYIVGTAILTGPEGSDDHLSRAPEQLTNADFLSRLNRNTTATAEQN